MSLYQYIQDVISDDIGSSYCHILGNENVIDAVRALDERLSVARIDIPFNPFSHFTTVPLDELKVVYVNLNPLSIDETNGILQVLEKNEYTVNIDRWKDLGVMIAVVSPISGEFSSVFQSVFIPIMNELNTWNMNNGQEIRYILSGIDVIKVYNMYIKVNHLIMCDYSSSWKFKKDNCFERLNKNLSNNGLLPIEW